MTIHGASCPSIEIPWHGHLMITASLSQDLNVANVRHACPGACRASTACISVCCSLVTQLTAAGILPGFGGTQRLPRLVGLQKACEMMLTSAPIPAEAGAKLGLVDALVSSAKLMETACQFALGIAEGSKPRNQVGCISPYWSCKLIALMSSASGHCMSVCTWHCGGVQAPQPGTMHHPMSVIVLYTPQSCWTLPAHLRWALLRLESLATRQVAPSHVSSSRWSVANPGASPNLGRT